MAQHRPNWYDVLGVSPQATAEEIRAAYRRRIRVLHPDVHTHSDPSVLAEATKAAAQLAAAWAVLGDPQRRQDYDSRERAAASGLSLAEILDTAVLAAAGMPGDVWLKLRGRAIESSFTAHREVYAEDVAEPAALYIAAHNGLLRTATLAAAAFATGARTVDIGVWADEISRAVVELAGNVPPNQAHRLDSPAPLARYFSQDRTVSGEPRRSVSAKQTTGNPYSDAVIAVAVLLLVLFGAAVLWG